MSTPDNAARARMGKLKKKAETLGITVHEDMTEEVLTEAIRQYEEANSGDDQKPAMSTGLSPTDLLAFGKAIGQEIAKGNAAVAKADKENEEETFIEPDPADIGDIKFYYAPYYWWILPAKRVGGKLVKAPLRKIVFKLDRGSAVQVGTQWQTKYVCVYATDNKKEQAYMESHPAFNRLFFLSHKGAEVTSEQTKHAMAFGRHLKALENTMATELHARGAKLGVLMSHDMSLHTLRTMIADKLATEEIVAEKLNMQRLVQEQDRLSLIQQTVNT